MQYRVSGKSIDDSIFFILKVMQCCSMYSTDATRTYTTWPDSIWTYATLGQIPPGQMPTYDRYHLDRFNLDIFHPGTDTTLGHMPSVYLPPKKCLQYFFLDCKPFHKPTSLIS